MGTVSTDALDDHIYFHVTGKPAPDEVRWAAFLAMWNRISRHCAIDFIEWAANGGTLFDDQRPHTWPPVPDEKRAVAQAVLKRIEALGQKETP